MTKQREKSYARLTEADIQQCIFVPRPEEKEVERIKPSTTVFTISGQEDELANELGQPMPNGYPVLWDIEYDDGQIVSAALEDNAYAKSSYTTGTPRFYIKEDGQHKFINPIGGPHEFKTKKQQLMKGQDDFKYREVGYKVFMLYLNFLKTKNKAFLLNAEREHG